jgi:hypothetical protein
MTQEREVVLLESHWRFQIPNCSKPIKQFVRGKKKRRVMQRVEDFVQG